jgi:hypothetical protein
MSMFLEGCGFLDVRMVGTMLPPKAPSHADAVRLTDRNGAQGVILP